MQKPFYKELLKEKYDINVIIPDENNMKQVHDIIYNELVLGTMDKESKKKYIEIINKTIRKRCRRCDFGMYRNTIANTTKRMSTYRYLIRLKYMQKQWCDML